MSGLGESECRLLGQEEESESMMCFKFGQVVGRLFRAIACTVGCEETDSNWMRMCDPF